MQTGNEAYTINERGWTVRIQPPREKENPRCLLLLHGWTGDEKVMWVFTRNLPANTWLFAPRGLVSSAEGGYGWLPHGEGWPRLDDFVEITRTLLDAFNRWRTDAGVPLDPFDVMGFSQGAATAYALAAYFPQAVNRIIALAGFLPPDDPMPGRYQNLAGKKIYVAHGTKDETVPVEMAQEAVRTLQALGAQVTYCESDVGHKLSASCLRGLEAFISK